MKKKLTIKNTLSSVLLQIVTIISGFIIPRLILKNFGSETNGLVSSLNQFLQYIALVEGGLTPVILSCLYSPLRENKKEKISGIVNAANRFFKKIAIIFVVYTILLALLYPLLVNTSFSYGFVSSLTLILSINLFIQYYFSLTWKTLLRADKKVYYTSFVQILCIVINTLLVIVIVKIWPNIHILKLLSSLIFLLQPLLYNRYINKHYDIDKKIAPDKDALSQRWNGFAINVAGFIHNNTDIVVLTLFSNLITVSIYSVYNMVSVSLKKLIGSVSEGIIPTLGHSYASGDRESLNNIFDLYEIIIYYLTFILFTCGGLLITPFVILYTKGVSDANYMQPLFGWIIILAEMTHCIKDPYVNMAYCAGKFKDISKHAIIEALINIVLSILLVSRYGLIGVAIGTLSAMLYRTAFHIIYLRNHILNRKLIKTIKNLVLFGCGLIICVLLSNYLFTVRNNSLLAWIIYAVENAVLVFLVYTSIMLLFYRDRVKFLLKYVRIKLTDKVYNIVTCVCILLLIGYVSIMFIFNTLPMIKYKNSVNNNDYVAHALGGIDNNSYTNSEEALINSYANGFKMYEVDINFSKDKKIVCVHGWSLNDYENRLGLEYNPNNSVMSYDEFKSIRIKDKYTPLSFEELAKFMSEKKDMYVMLDIGSANYENTKDIYEEIYRIAKEYGILNNIIVGGHTSDMIKAVKDVYNFKIINLYWETKENRKDVKIDTKEEFVTYCKNNNITSLSTSVNTFNKEIDIMKYFKENGLIIYVFTENNVNNSKEMLKIADLVGTDFINN